MRELWAKVDGYFGALLAPSDAALDHALAANREADLPPQDVSLLQAKFLDLLVRISGARKILEIGTLGAYSTIWFARVVGPEGRIVTLEVEPKHAEIARSNLAVAGMLDRVDLRLGNALETLPVLADDGSGPFDLIFIDADKSNNPFYLPWVLQLSRPGTVIVADNIVRNGNVIDPDNPEPYVQGVRRFTEMVAAEPRLSATAMQTVGAKGYDGFILAVVLA